MITTENNKVETPVSLAKKIWNKTKGCEYISY